jgi:DNA-binding CsgD family transcriptional regulator
MFATCLPETHETHDSAARASAAATPPAHLYRGPDRRQARDHWAHAVFDELDFGVLLLSPLGDVLYANRVARAELAGEHPLRLSERMLKARDVHDAAALQTALDNASRRDLRRLLAIGTAGHRTCISIVPLGAARRDGGILMMLARRETGPSLAVDAFARSQGLTPAETRVLIALCQHVPPREIARRCGVEISTVRSQIGSIRQKTGASNIRALIGQVSGLPPLMSVLGRLMQHEAAEAVDATPAGAQFAAA